MVELRKLQKKTPPYGRSLHFLLQASISRILYSRRKVGMIAICLGPALLRDSSDSSLDFSRGTILHRSKYLAVSAGLNRVVSVRNSVSLRKGITLYFFPLSGICVRTFLPSPLEVRGSYPIPAQKVYNTCILFASMLYSFCECEVRLTFIVNNISATKVR
ncbi:MAG: hypothetical protein G01um101424_279 [Parcubacteria group bacterium Gr01-1014_24]|nr:MAG: hypothetical protein G01um101424_279 [Parcubacteria group bacterium Gr01-1014_24]